MRKFAKLRNPNERFLSIWIVELSASLAELVMRMSEVGHARPRPRRRFGLGPRGRRLGARGLPMLAFEPVRHGAVRALRGRLGHVGRGRAVGSGSSHESRPHAPLPRLAAARPGEARPRGCQPRARPHDRGVPRRDRRALGKDRSEVGRQRRALPLCRVSEARGLTARARPKPGACPVRALGAR